MGKKQDIKKRIVQLRDSMDDVRRKQHSQMIMQRLMQTEEYRAASFLYCYMHMRSEVMTDELIQAAIRDGKRVAVPKVTGATMDFYELGSLTDVCTGYMGIREPRSDKVQKQPGLILVPGTVFDRAGNRIGYGGGFYDRYLEHRPYHIKAGLAYEQQVVPMLLPEAHDIAMDMVITEQYIYGKK